VCVGGRAVGFGLFGVPGVRGVAAVWELLWAPEAVLGFTLDGDVGEYTGEGAGPGFVVHVR
jgi:hypothetical protein